MNTRVGVGIHNRFDIEVRDSVTGKLKQTGVAYNIVLNQMYTRLCGGSTYFVNIHYGTGTGTLDAARTSLFTHLGTKTPTNVELVKSIPTSSWKRSIVLNPEEHVGSTLTEVGIAFGATSTNLVTHAVIKDSEGNPISIEKTATDLVTIHATVFVTFDTTNTDLSYLGMPNSNTLVNYLIGGSAAPTGSFGLKETLHSATRLGSSSNATWTSNVGDKKRETNVLRFGVSVANGHAKHVEFTNLFDLELPSAGIFTGQLYEGVPIGVGDGVEDTFVVPSFNVQDASLSVEIDDVPTVAYTEKTMLGLLVEQADPTTMPGNNVRSCAWHSDSNGTYLAVGSWQSDATKFTWYKLVDGVLTVQADPTTMPGNNVYSCAWLSDSNGTYLAVGSFVTNATKFTWYKSRANKTAIVFTTNPGLITAEAVGTGDGTTTVFTLDNTPIGGVADIYVDGGLVAPADYDLTGETITFDTAPGNTLAITADYKYEAAITADYTVDGIHKTDQYIVDVSFAIEFGEVV